MRVPLIIWIATWIQLLPPMVAARRWRRLDAAHRGVLVWFLMLVSMDLGQYLWSRVLHLGSNIILEYAYTPLQGALILWALAEWQVHPVARSTVRICIPLGLAWWAATTAFFEDTSNFSVLSSPVLSLLALAAALLAFVMRSQAEDEVPVLRSSWAWILAGIAVHFATNGTISIFQAVVTARQDWVMLERALRYKAAIDIFATLCITGGFLWPTPPRSSGASSSPAR